MASCLLCCQTPFLPSPGLFKTPSLLGRQLEVIFVLRQLLHIPSEKLSSFLMRSAGENPDTWIRLCEPCQRLVKEAFSLFEQLVEIQQKLRRIQHRIVDKIKLHNSRKEDWIAAETRTFVRNYDYGAFESTFVEGDRRAKRQAQMKDVVPKQEIEEANDDSDHCISSTEDPYPYSSDNDGEENVSSKSVTAASRKGKYRCPQCPATFSFDQNRRRHIKVIHESGKGYSYPQNPESPRLTCPICQKTYMSKSGLRGHRRQAHPHVSRTPIPGSLWLTCHICQKIYHSKSGLRGHRRQAHPDVSLDLWRSKLAPKPEMKKIPVKKEPKSPVVNNPVLCPLCGETFLGSMGLATHQRQKHPEQRPPPLFPCRHCPSSFPTKVIRYHHERTKHRTTPEDPLKKQAMLARQRRYWRERYRMRCPHCPFLDTHPKLKLHMAQEHKGQYPLHCEICGRGVQRQQILTRHKAEMHFICGVKDCGVQLESKGQLYEHQLAVHGKSLNMFKCEKCNGFWVTRQRLDRHDRKVHQEKGSHICEQCGKCFPIRESLHSHVRYMHQTKIPG